MKLPVVRIHRGRYMNRIKVEKLAGTLKLHEGEYLETFEGADSDLQITNGKSRKERYKVTANVGDIDTI